MSGEAIDNALSRMEAALARIERAAIQAPADDTDLVHRHDLLRAAVGESLRELDALLTEGNQ